MSDTARGRINRSGCLVVADAWLSGLHQRAGGTLPGPVVLPALARLIAVAQEQGGASRKQIRIADGARDGLYWAHVMPDIDGVSLTLWTDGEAIETRVGRSAESARVRLDEPLFDPSITTAAALRGPIVRIMDQARRLSRADASPAFDYADYGRDIADAAQHLLGLADDLGSLDAVAGNIAVTVSLFNAGPVLDQAAAMLNARAMARNMTLVVECASPLMAQGDERRVLQILLNLIGNAIRYAPHGTPVLISGVLDRKGCIQLSVQDQGSGIAPQDRHRLFGKYERLGRNDGEGSGLGLFLSRRLARAMGGDLELANTSPDQGAMFILTLVPGAV